jgi:hypothetical protein
LCQFYDIQQTDISSSALHTATCFDEGRQAPPISPARASASSEAAVVGSQTVCADRRPPRREQFEQSNSRWQNHSDRQADRCCGNVSRSRRGLPGCLRTNLRKATVIANAVAAEPLRPCNIEGFVYNYALKNAANPTIMNCFTPATVRVVSSLAYYYAVCDHWFSSIPSQTLCNRSFVQAGTSSGYVNNGGKDGILFVNETPTIFNLSQKSTQFAGDSCAASRFASARELRVPRRVALPECLSRDGKARRFFRRSPECARNFRMRSDESRDDDRTRGTVCSRMSQMR